MIEKSERDEYIEQEGNRGREGGRRGMYEGVKLNVNKEGERK